MILIIGGAFQGKRNFALKELKIGENKILSDFHTKMRECLTAGNDPEILIEKALSGEYQAVICDEIGCGIIPLDRADRQWREETGRALCRIGAECNEIWRVICGTGVKIKG